MSIATGLFIADMVALSICIAMLTHAAYQAYIKIPMIYKLMLGLIFILFFIMDSIWARFYLDIGFFNEDQFFAYRYLIELVLGVVGWYIVIDISAESVKRRKFLKFGTIILGSNFFTALLLLSYFVPEIRDNSIGFLFLLNEGVPLWIQTFIFIAKLFGLGGIFSFLLLVCMTIIRSKLFSKFSIFFMIMGILSIVDDIILIPILDIYMNFQTLELSLILWLSSFIFIIFARLNRINMKVVMNIHDLIIVHKSGIPIFSLTDGKMDPALISSALSGVTSILQEISGTKDKIQSIEEENIKILFDFGEDIFIVIIVEGESLILKKMLSKLLSLFEEKYSILLDKWNGDISLYCDAKTIVESVFSQVEWKQELNCMD